MIKVKHIITNHFWFFFTLILALAFLLRLPLLNGSFWLDESAQVLESARPLNKQLEIAHDFQPPLMHLLTHFALYLGQSEAWLRFVGALVPGIITIAGLMLGVKERYCCHSEFISESETRQLEILKQVQDDNRQVQDGSGRVSDNTKQAWGNGLLVSLLAGFLLATNTWHIFYSQELRPYSLPAMFATLTWLVLIKYLASSIQHPNS